MLDEVHAIRRAMGRACSYRSQIDKRWGDLWSVGAWLPAWDGTAWTARLAGVVYLGATSEIVVTAVHDVVLTPFGPCVLGSDVRDHVARAIGSVAGVKNCGDPELSAVYGEIAQRGGFKAVLARRGLQQGVAR